MRRARPAALDPAADVGIIILEQGGFRPMSGANTMCTVTALLETGSLPATEPETVVRVDTAVGPVEATARVDGGRVPWVRVRNVPWFVVALDRKIVVPEYGTIAADVAFGGQFYVMARAADMGVALGPEHAPAITRAGTALLAAAREQVAVAHPEQPDVTEIGLAMLHGPADSPGVSGRNSVVMPSGRITLGDPASWTGTLDRSPGGTGTSARMAALHARGELGLGVPFVHEGVLASSATRRAPGCPSRACTTSTDWSSTLARDDHVGAHQRRPGHAGRPRQRAGSGRGGPVRPRDRARTPRRQAGGLRRDRDRSRRHGGRCGRSPDTSPTGCRQPCGGRPSTW